MPFDAKALRVQLPCRSLTVLEGEEYERDVKAKRALRDLFTPRLSSPEPCCARATGEVDCVRGTGDIDFGHLTDHLCMGTDALETRFTVEASVLPVLRRELEKRLAEIAVAEEAVARAVNGSTPDRGAAKPPAGAKKSRR